MIAKSVAASSILSSSTALGGGTAAGCVSQTALESLVGDLGICSHSSYCAYHLKKRDNRSIYLPSYFERQGGERRVLLPEERVVQAANAIRNGFQLSGNWPLMGEQSQWLRFRLAAVPLKPGRPCSVAILGVPGVTHFRDFTSLASDSIRRRPINLFVFDRCVKPLLDIIAYLRLVGYQDNPRGSDRLVCPPLASLTCGTVNCTLICTDLSGECPLMERSIDVACSHFLLQYLDAGKAHRLATNIRSFLHPLGHYILAESYLPYLLPSVPQYFEEFGLSQVDSTRAWNLYQLTSDECDALAFGKSITISGDVQLVDLVASN